MINGAYDEKTNTIYLRADATYNATDVRGILGHTLAHEVTHSIKTWSEADYNVLTDYIRDALEADFDALVNEKMDKLGMSYAMASDEVIADGCEMLLRDSKALEKLAMENASLFVKVVTKVREFIANLRKAQTDMYGGSEELHDAALKLREALKSLEEVQEVFDNALENSIRNMRDALAEAENAKTRENLDVLEKQAEKEGVHIENDGIKYSTEKTFDEQIDDVLNGKHNPRLDLYVSKTPGYLLKLNFSDSPMLMRNGKISEILNKHSDMSAEILKMIPKAIEDPVLVLKSKTNPANSVVIITDILTSKGEMIIPVWANQSGNYIDLDLGDISLNANFVASAYGRNTENLIKYAVNHNGVLYQNSDTKRVIQLLARNGLQLPTPLKLSDSIINVSEKGAAVNSKLQNSEEISERDAEYLKLAKDPKKNAAQLRKLVYEAAKAAGFAKRLYHGTKGFGSTQVDTGYSDDGISFFMSDDERVTSWYSGTDEKKPIGKNISENGANNYEFYANTDNMYEIDDYGAQWDNILDADALDSEDAINKAFPESEGFTWDENDGFLNVYRDDVFYGEYVWDDESDRYVPNLPGRDPLPSRADGFGAGTTRSLSRAIYDSGKYSGVIFRKIHDAGFDNGNTYADIYNFFYPESQVKSADLGTYDDNGNIIPLSERFNTEKNELRFSEETADEFAENEKSAIEKALANMSVKDYNRRGWARTLLTREDASKLYSAVAELFTNKKRKEFRLKDGSYAVEVNNKIVFVSGTFENPRYESVLVFNTDNATEMEILKYYFFRDTATNDLTVKDIKRFINQRRNYGQVDGFNAEDYKASGKSDFGRAILRSGTKGFGDISQFEVRDGVYTKDEGDVSLRVQGLKFSEETDSDISAKTAAKLKKSKRQKGCRAAAFLLSLFDSLKPMQSGFFWFLGAFSQKSTLSGAWGETPHIHSPMVGARGGASHIYLFNRLGRGAAPHIYLSPKSGCGARSPANIINQ